MKKTVLILAPLLLAALLLVLAAQLWLRPQVENQARQALAGLTSFDGSPVQSSVEVLDFSPLTRKLLLRGLELRMVQPQGPVTYQAAEISLRLPLRAMLACTPLRGAVLPEQGMTTVAEGLLLLNVSARTSLGKVVHASGKKSTPSMRTAPCCGSWPKARSCPTLRGSPTAWARTTSVLPSSAWISPP